MTRKTGLIASALAAAVMTFAPMAPASALPAIQPGVQHKIASSDVTPVQNRSIDAMR